MLEHHAYLCRTSAVDIAILKAIRASFAVEAETQFIHIDAFGIDDVRALTQKAFIKPGQGDTLLLVVGLKSITIESQQALLKILEEPPSSTVFLFVVPETLTLLPTTLSRFQEYQGAGAGEQGVTFLDYADFKKLSPAQRTILIAEKMTAKDALWVEAIKVGLQHDLKQQDNLQNKANLATLYFIAEHLQTRGAGNKMLLEELAFSLT